MWYVSSFNLFCWWMSLFFVRQPSKKRPPRPSLQAPTSQLGPSQPSTCGALVEAQTCPMSAGSPQVWYTSIVNATLCIYIYMCIYTCIYVWLYKGSLLLLLVLSLLFLWLLVLSLSLWCVRILIYVYIGSVSLVFTQICSATWCKGM